MASYATLLEDAMVEEQYKNTTFTELSGCLESLTAFVNEDTEFNVMISLTEAESGDIKDKAAKISAAVKQGIHNLIEKIKKFIDKIGEAVKRFVEKAHVVIASNGNNAMAKLLKDNSLTVGKDIKLTAVLAKVDKGSGTTKNIEDLFVAAQTASETLNKRVGFFKERVDENTMANWSKANQSTDMEQADKVIEAFKSDIGTAEHSDAAMIKAKEAKKVSDVYKNYVAVILDPINDHLSKIEETCGNAQKTGKAVIKALQQAEKEGTTAPMLSAVSAYVSKVMQLHTYTVNFASRLLTIATKNSAKIALAAVDAQGRSAAAAVSGKVKGAKDTVARKAKAAKEA